jgi:hypothetical protein
MPNTTGNVYALTTLCPLEPELKEKNRSAAALLREYLDNLPLHEQSPMAKVPDTYVSRFFVLDDLVLQSLDVNPVVPWKQTCKPERLQSDYLVFIADFHGPELEPYLLGMWAEAREDVKEIWKYCLGFADVDSGESFVAYLKRCQVPTTFCFNGSTDESLAEQLKGLYLKQELAKFAFEHQRRTDEELQEAFSRFLIRTRPEDLDGPSWRPGAARLESAVVGEEEPPSPLPDGGRPPASGTGWGLESPEHIISASAAEQVST